MQTLEKFLFDFQNYKEAKANNISFRISEQDTVDADHGMILSEAILNYSFVFNEEEEEDFDGSDLIDTLYFNIELNEELELTEDEILNFTYQVQEGVSLHLNQINEENIDNPYIFKLFDIVWGSLTSGENTIQVLVFMSTTSPLTYGFDVSNCSYLTSNHWWAPYPNQGNPESDTWICWGGGGLTSQGTFYGSWSSLARFSSLKSCNGYYRPSQPNYPPIHGCQYTYYNISTTTISYDYQNSAGFNHYYANNMLFRKFGEQAVYCLNGLEMNQYLNGIRSITQDILIPGKEVSNYYLQIIMV